MNTTILPALAVLGLLALGCNEASTAPAVPRCLGTESPVVNNGFMVVAADASTTVYDFDRLASPSEIYANVTTGYGTVEITTRCSNLLLTGVKDDTSTVSMTLLIRGVAAGIYTWEGGRSTRSGIKLTISGGPHGGSYVPVSGSTEIQEIALGPQNLVKARFCGVIEGLNGKTLTIRGGRLLVR